MKKYALAKLLENTLNVILLKVTKLNHILSALTKSAQSIKTLQGHSLKAASLDQKIQYLNVLSLVYDNGIVSSNYLEILLSAVDIDLSMTQDFIEFSSSPDEETIVSFIREFRSTSFAIPFLSDCLMLCACEDEILVKHESVINKLAMELQIFGSQFSAVMDNFSLVKKGLFENVNIEHISEHIISYYRVQDVVSETVVNKKRSLDNMLDDDKTASFMSKTTQVSNGRRAVNKTVKLISLINTDTILLVVNTLLNEKKLSVRDSQDKTFSPFSWGGSNDKEHVVDEQNNVIFEAEKLGLELTKDNQFVVKEGCSPRFTSSKAIFTELIYRAILLDVKDFEDFNVMLKSYNLRVLTLRKLNGVYNIPRIGGGYSTGKVILVGKDKYIFTNATNCVSSNKTKKLTDLPALLSINHFQLETLDDEKYP